MRMGVATPGTVISNISNQIELVVNLFFSIIPKELIVLGIYIVSNPTCTERMPLLAKLYVRWSVEKRTVYPVPVTGSVHENVSPMLAMK
jgi:hypothetical protein